MFTNAMEPGKLRKGANENIRKYHTEPVSSLSYLRLGAQITVPVKARRRLARRSKILACD